MEETQYQLSEPYKIFHPIEKGLIHSKLLYPPSMIKSPLEVLLIDEK